MRTSKTPETNERGSALIEFALCITLFWVPLFLGTYEIGFSLIREVQVTQVCRDAGHMYSQGTDFSLASYQNLLKSLAPGNFNMSATGNTVLYFSTVTYVDDTYCPGGLLPDSTSCPNYHKLVFTRQIPIGNTSLRQSDFGTPLSAIMDGGYNIAPRYFLKDSSAVAANFSTLIPLASSSQFAYMSEMYVQSPDLSFWNYLGTPGEYARSIF